MTSADSLFACGAEFHAGGNLEAAKVHYAAALLSEPNHLSALMNLSDIFSRQNKLAAAAATVSRVLAVLPNLSAAWTNYGNFLTRLERYDEARFAFERCVELAPSNTANWHNFLLLNLREGHFDDAFYCYKQVIDLGSGTPLLENDHAHVLLGTGNLQEALEVYEARWCALFHLEPWDLRIPEWAGEDLSQSRILVHHEQGHGDTIMTSRFVKSLAERAESVSFAVPKNLLRLFAAQDWPVDVINLHELTEADAQRFDFHSPLYSAMRHLGIGRSDIDPTPYLKAPPITVKPVYPGVLNVGICWASGMHGGDFDWRRRVSPLELWLKLAEVPNVQLWSLYPGEVARNEIMAAGADAVVLDRVSNFTDFAETAAFTASLDLVITVDTAIAHLSGALGIPTWMLSQFTPCWRWWSLDEGNGLPWYDKMWTFKQRKPGAWSEQLDECAELLQAMSEGRGRRIAA